MSDKTKNIIRAVSDYGKSLFNLSPKVGKVWKVRKTRVFYNFFNPHNIYN
jgi:hypothetical protein